jgi:hypothetical protein
VQVSHPTANTTEMHEPPTADGLTVTVRVVPLPDHESNPLRARQLAVIVDLLRCTASEGAERDAAPRKPAQA